MKITLRDYQVDNCDSIKNAYRSGYRYPLYVLPTGGGKTPVMLHIAELIQYKGRRVWILIHKREILDQMIRHLELLGADFGVVAPGYPVTGELIQVLSAYTASNRIGKLPRPDFIMIDEAHHSIAKTWSNIIKYYSDAFILGATATPFRLDGKGLGINYGGHFDIIIEGPKPLELMDMGYLTPSITFAPPTPIDMSEVKIIGGDFEKRKTESIVNKPIITGCAINQYLQTCPGTRAIAFCATIKHAEDVSQQYNSAGIPSLSIDGKLTNDQRRYRINALASGQIKVLTSCKLISEGTDIPVVETIIDLSPTMSLNEFLQRRGRGLRPAPQIKKEKCFILDHAGNCFRHGFVEDNREWSLEGIKKKPKKQPEDILNVRTCKNCFAMFPPYLSKCPQCGSEYNTVERKIQQIAGNLVQVNKTDIENHKKQQRMEVGRAETLEDFIAIGERRGYNPKWAHIRYQLRQRKKQYA